MASHHSALHSSSSLVGSANSIAGTSDVSRRSPSHSDYGTLRGTSPGTYERIISRPARVEPKVHLANERTLFHWLNLAVVLTTVAVGFLNSSLPGAAWLAVLFTVAASGMMIYALRYYYWRMDRIAHRDVSDYTLALWLHA
ncbi:hypothetical protein SYNPS1DRAFT_27118 [Syncephalis pseudoplumigaleata]|uniref:DUF202 domain-containing protein n=1 Tax=Syncephalis pseudoplumigaleata TaxID=1712513 RepID=A0A4P9Z405_9FUNG|nr:hypothetical protein SYNPS1DRAFT_27118 [Syncephalis pseudoplumigaleata]|eukprot:RKP27216.1 hypothetical protein SYNPS1DRAFT_27118 [Syncephalis pseudoplumigaleata]